MYVAIIKIKFVSHCVYFAPHINGISSGVVSYQFERRQLQYQKGLPQTQSGGHVVESRFQHSGSNIREMRHTAYLGSPHEAE